MTPHKRMGNAAVDVLSLFDGERSYSFNFFEKVRVVNLLCIVFLLIRDSHGLT